MAGGALARLRPEGTAGPAAAGRGLERGLTVVLPARDEAATVGQVIEAALDALDVGALAGEVVVVDDGSTDPTAEVVRRWELRDPRVRLLRHGRSRGYGAALRAGFAAARHGHVFFTDADGQFDPRELARLLPWTADHELVVGVRRQRADGPWRRAGGRAWTGLVGGLLGVRSADVDCAFKLARREVLEAAALRCDGAGVNAELLAWATARGLRVKEVPVSHYPRRAGRPSGLRPGVVLRGLGELARLRWQGGAPEAT